MSMDELFTLLRPSVHLNALDKRQFMKFKYFLNNVRFSSRRIQCIDLIFVLFNISKYVQYFNVHLYFVKILFLLNTRHCIIVYFICFQ